MTNKNINVAYADDHVTVRKAIIALIENFGNINIIIEADNGKDLLNYLENAMLLPDIILLDVQMPVMDGFEIMSNLKNKWPNIKTLAFTAFESEFFLIKMINMGVNGYILKRCPPLKLKQAINDIYDFGFYYDGLFQEHFFNRVKRGEIKVPHFTEKEIEYLKYCPTELTYKEIAIKMNTTVKAIESCMTRLSEKLNVKGRIGLAVYSVQLGFSKKILINLTQKYSSIFSTAIAGCSTELPCEVKHKKMADRLASLL